MSLGAAVSTYTGQNIGAGLKDRVRKGFNSATLVSSIFALAVGVVSGFLHRQLRPYSVKMQML